MTFILLLVQIEAGVWQTPASFLGRHHSGALLARQTMLYSIEQVQDKAIR